MNPVPAHLEADLLALVEGEAITPDRAVLVAEAFRADPGLAATIRAMQADRAATASLPAIQAPADLLGRVESVLEREALVGPALREPVGLRHVPVSRLQPAGVSAWRRFRGSRWAAPLSLAALLALVAGASLLALSGGPKPRTVALNTPRQSAPIAGTTGATGADALASTEKYGRPMSKSGGGLADRTMDRGANLITQTSMGNRGQPSMEDTAGDRSDDRPASRGMVAARVESGTSGDVRLAGALGAKPGATTAIADRARNEEGEVPLPSPGAEPEAPTLTLDRAAELARAGRLAVRLTSTTPERVEERLRAVANRFSWAGAPQPVPQGEAQELRRVALGPSFKERDLSVLRVIEAPGSPTTGAALQPVPAPAIDSDASRGDRKGGPPPASAPAPAPTPAPASPAGPPPDQDHPPVLLAGTSSSDPVAFRLTAPADAARLSQLLTAMRGEPGWSGVELVELLPSKDQAENAGAHPGKVDVPDPTLFVWWTLSPRQWAPRATLPVLVEPVSTTRHP